jgi:DNA segregation ATPase FtsK/SpoIIIE, S-DNA-T family
MAEYNTGTPATDAPAGGGDLGAANFTAALLQATLSACKVTAMVAPLWAGPQLLTFACSLGLGEDPQRVERLTGALALAAGAETARVARDAGKLIIEIPRPLADRKPLKAGRLDKLTPPTATAVALGVTTGGRVAWLDLADSRTPHVLIAGTTGSGKTTGLHWLLYRLIRQNDPAALRFIMLDPKRGALLPFANVPHLLHPIASSPLDMTRLLTWAEDELDRRLDSGKRGPRVIVVMEEIADIMKRNPAAGDVLARLAQEGRGLGVHVIGVTQQPGARSLGDALANFPARLLGRVASATLTYGAAGRGKTMADQLLGNGDFLLIRNDATTRLQLPMIGGAQYGQLPRAARVDRLDNELPTLANLADLAGRDPRGGPGRRELGAEQYEDMTQALASGAGPDDLRKTFGIGWDRATRIFRNFNEGATDE